MSDTDNSFVNRVAGSEGPASMRLPLNGVQVYNEKNTLHVQSANHPREQLTLERGHIRWEDVDLLAYPHPGQKGALWVAWFASDGILDWEVGVVRYPPSSSTDSPDKTMRWAKRVLERREELQSLQMGWHPTKQCRIPPVVFSAFQNPALSLLR